MFDEFGGIDVGDDDRRVERFAHLFHGGDGTLRPHAHDHAIRVHQIPTAKPSRRNSGLLITSNSTLVLQ